MYKNEREWREAIEKDDLAATVGMLQTTRLPQVSRSAQLTEIRRKLLAQEINHEHWVPQLVRKTAAVASLAALLLMVSVFWMNQANQTSSAPDTAEDTAVTLPESQPEDPAAIVISSAPEVQPETESLTESAQTVTETAVVSTDQVWWLAVRRQLTDPVTTLTSYEIQVGYELDTVDTAVAQIFLGPKNWQSLTELYAFSDPVTISAEDDNITITMQKNLEEFFQNIPPRTSSLIVAVYPEGSNTPGTYLALDEWKNFVDTEYFAGPIYLAPDSDSALNVFDWEFDTEFFSVEAPPRRISGTEVVPFVVNYHYQLTQTSRAYIKVVLVDRTHGNRRLDSAFIRADAGVGLITAYLEFNPAQVNGSANLAIESFIVRDGIESPAQSAGGWVYTPSE